MASITSTARADVAAGRESDARAEPLERIREALDGLLYGSVTIVVHDGSVVQIDRTEKVRLSRSAAAGT